MSVCGEERMPFRVVVREVVNLFEDDEDSRFVIDEKAGQYDVDTFEMTTAHPRDTSLRTIIGDPDTEFQGKQELTDGQARLEFEENHKVQDEDDLFDDSFQAPPTPCHKDKALPAVAATLAKSSEEDDDIFSDIDTQAFHIPSKADDRKSGEKPKANLNEVTNEPRQLSKPMSPSRTPTSRKENIPSFTGALNGGFKTAGGKSVNVSAKALSIVKKMFADDMQDDSKANCESVVPSETSVEKLPPSRTEQGNPVEDAASPQHQPAGRQNDSRGPFNKSITQQRPADDTPTGGASSFEGFKTAGGKNVAISLKHLKTVKTMFEKELSQMPIPDSAQPKPDHTGRQVRRNSSTTQAEQDVKLDTTPTGNIGFMSANGNAIKVSAKALESVRRLFQEEACRADNAIKSTEVAVEKIAPPAAATLGFVTAAGRSVPISEEHLRVARKVLDDTDLGKGSSALTNAPIDDGNKSGNAASGQKRPNASGNIANPESAGEAGPKIVGFSTAAGASVPINEKHLDAVRRILEADSLPVRAPTSPVKMLTVSDAAIERSIRLFNDATEEKANVGMNSSKTPIRRVSGLKRRSTPMCHTPLNGPSTPITPLEPEVAVRATRSTRQKSSLDTPPAPAVAREDSEGHRRKTVHLVKGQDVSDAGLSSTASSTEVVPAPEKVPPKKALRDLMLVDRPLAPAGPDWFQDDESGLKVTLDDAMEAFSKMFNTSSKSDFDLWFANHFEQVVWKLSSYSGRIRELSGCLRLENVLEQLRKRWTLEVQGTHRSPLRTIVERDHSSERTMTLLVKQVSPELVLSDGWYSVPCDVDPLLAALISRTNTGSGICVGHKLCISGATLRGARNGVDPLHLEGARLSIHYNSTRRARWFARLGFCRRTLTVPLLSAQPNGGSLPLVRVRVTSCSNLMYFEKFPQGGSIIRKESEEIKERRKFEDEIAKIHERIRNEVQEEIDVERPNSKRRLRSRGKINVSKLSSGEEIYEALESSHDPSQLMADLTASQKRMLERYHDSVRTAQCARIEEAVRRKMDELRQREQCPPERKVAALLKLLVRCVSSGVEIPLTVWRPSDELRALLSQTDVVVAILRANVTLCRNFPFGLTTTQATKFHGLTTDSSTTDGNDSKSKKQKRLSALPSRDSAGPSKRPRLHSKFTYD